MFDRFWGRGKVFASRESPVYLYKTFLFMGFAQPNTQGVLYWIYANFIKFFVLLSPILFNMGYIVNIKQMKTTQLLTALQGSFNVSGNPIKAIVVSLGFKQLLSTGKIMDELDARCTSKDELKRVRWISMSGNRFMVGFAVVYYGYALVNCIVSVALEQPIYSVYTPFWNWRDSHMDFVKQSVYEYIYVFYLVLYQIADDCFPVIYIYVIRMHMQLLVERVKRLGSDPEKSNDGNFKELILCIRDHQNLVKLLDTVSPVMSVTMFLQLLIAAAIVGTIMINVLIFADMSTRISALSYLCCVVTQISPCCYQATYLMEDSDKLPIAIFHSNWIGQDKRYRRMLIFFMQRAQQTMTVTAMKMFVVNLNTNLSIIKFSFSLYTLINNMGFGK